MLLEASNISRFSQVHCYCNDGEVQKGNSRSLELFCFHITLESNPRVLLMHVGYQHTDK